MMTVETYWLFVAPGLLLGLSSVGWVTLWITRRHKMQDRPEEVSGLGRRYIP